MVEHKDVVIAVMGASAGLAGLVLVFLGLVATATASFPPGTKKDIVAKARKPAYAVLASFGLGLACVAFATWWLILLRGSAPLYAITVYLFFAQLASLAVATVWSVRRAMWG